MIPWGTNLEYFTAQEVGEVRVLSETQYQSLERAGLLISGQRSPDHVVQGTQDNRYYFRLTTPRRTVRAVREPQPPRPGDGFDDHPFPSMREELRNEVYFRNAEVRGECHINMRANFDAQMGGRMRNAFEQLTQAASAMGASMQTAADSIGRAFRPIVEIDFAAMEERMATWMANAPGPSPEVLARGGMLTPEQNQRFLEALQRQNGPRLMRTVTGRTSSRGNAIDINTPRSIPPDELDWVLELCGDVRQQPNMRLLDPPDDFRDLVYTSPEVYYIDEIVDLPPTDEFLDKLVIDKVVPSEKLEHLRLAENGELYYLIPLQDFDLRWVMRSMMEPNEFCTFLNEFYAAFISKGERMNTTRARHLVRRMDSFMADPPQQGEKKMLAMMPNQLSKFMLALAHRPQTVFKDYSPKLRYYNHCEQYKRNRGRRKIYL